MPFKKVQTIKIGSFDAGTFAGGFIYGANFTVGGVSQPSKLTLSVIDEGFPSRKGTLTERKRYGSLRGLRNRYGEDLSIRPADEYKVTIGRGTADIELNMNLISYSEEKTPTENTMTFEFVDTSHILDRVFVGLPHRHQKPTLYDGIYLLKDLEALCPNCFSGVANRKVTASMLAIRSAAFSQTAESLTDNNNMEVNWQTNPTGPKTLLRKGGIITCGREEFIDHGSSGFVPVYTEAITQKMRSGKKVTVGFKVVNAEVPCDIPNVSYKFADLLSAIRHGFGRNGAGIELRGLPKEWESQGINNDYRQTYTGTLREVLNNWCSDFAYGFVWDFPDGTKERIIHFIDLKNGVRSDFHSVKRLVENAQLIKESTKTQETPFLVSTMNYSKTMENTYSHNYLSHYLKPNRQKTFSPFSYFQANFHCLRVNEVLSPGACGILNDTPLEWSQFLISCALAKFDPTARVVYNAMIGRWWAIGITPIRWFEGRDRKVMIETLDDTDMRALRKRYRDAVNKGFREGEEYNHISLCMCFTNQDTADDWQDFEATIANDFIGKHYLVNPQESLSDFESCWPTMDFKQEIEMTPQCTKLVNAQEVPWASIIAKSPAIMRGNALLNDDGTGIESGWEGVGSYVSQQMALNASKNLWHFSIGAKWGTSADDMDWVLHKGAPESFNNKLTGDKDVRKGKNLEQAIQFKESLHQYSAFATWLGNQNVHINQELSAGFSDAYYGWNNSGPVDSESMRITPGLSASSAYGASSTFGAERTGGITNPYHPKHKDRMQGRPWEGVKLMVFDRLFVQELGFSVLPTKSGHTNFFSSETRESTVNVQECSIRCDSGLLETMCRCPTQAQMEATFTLGLLSRRAPSALLTFGGHTGKNAQPIVFPINSGISHAVDSNYSFAKKDSNLYHGWAKRSNTIRVLLEGQKFVLGDDDKDSSSYSYHRTINSEIRNLPQNTMSIRVTAKDITNDADMTSHTLGGNDTPIDSTPKLINVIVPTAGTSTGESDRNVNKDGVAGEKMMTLLDYHAAIRSNLTGNNNEHLKPAEEFSFSIVGASYDIYYGDKNKDKNLKYYLTPSKGLKSFNVSFGAQGLTTSFVFSTRPSEYPAEETMMRKIGPSVWKSWYH